MPKKENPVKVLVLYGGVKDNRRNKALQWQVKKFISGAVERDAICEVARLGEYDFVAQNAKPTHRIRKALYPLRDKILGADILVHATLVHWGKPSTLTSLCIDQVEAPLEWSSSKKHSGWRCWAKTLVMITVGDDSGDSSVNATTLERGTDRGLFAIGWGSHRKHLGMPKSEFGYQDEPDVVARIAVEHAKRMRGFPHWTTFLST